MRGRRIAAFVLAAATLAACTSTTSGDPTTAPTPTHVSPTSSIPAPTTSAPTTSVPRTSPTVPTTGPNVRPGEKPPKLSEVANTDTKAGALLSAEYWFEALDWAYATTDSSIAKGLYEKSCTECVRFVSLFDNARENSETLHGGRIDVTAAAIVIVTPHSATVDVKFRQGGVRELDSMGRIVEATPGESTTRYRVRLQRRRSSWAVTDLKEVVVR